VYLDLKGYTKKRLSFFTERYFELSDKTDRNSDYIGIIRPILQEVVDDGFKESIAGLEFKPLPALSVVRE